MSFHQTVFKAGDRVEYQPPRKGVARTKPVARRLGTVVRVVPVNQQRETPRAYVQVRFDDAAEEEIVAFTPRATEYLKKLQEKPSENSTETLPETKSEGKRGVMRCPHCGKPLL